MSHFSDFERKAFNVELLYTAIKVSKEPILSLVVFLMVQFLPLHCLCLKTKLSSTLIFVLLDNLSSNVLYMAHVLENVLKSSISPYTPIAFLAFNSTCWLYWCTNLRLPMLLWGFLCCKFPKISHLHIHPKLLQQLH